MRAETVLLEELEAVLRLALAAGGRDPSFWMRLLDDLTEVAGDRAVGLAVRALSSEDYNRRTLAQEHLVGLAKAYPQTVLRELGAAILSPSSSRQFPFDNLSHIIRELPMTDVRERLTSTGLAGARVLAPHLDPPHIDKDGRPVVTELTAFVLDRFADDEQVFRRFWAGAQSGRTYGETIAPEYAREEAVARRFCDHPLRRVRDWAKDVVMASRRRAAYLRQLDEEMVGH